MPNRDLVQSPIVLGRARGAGLWTMELKLPETSLLAANLEEIGSVLGNSGLEISGQFVSLDRGLSYWILQGPLSGSLSETTAKLHDVLAKAAGHWGGQVVSICPKL